MADIHIEMLKWLLLFQTILWPIFMEYCGPSVINHRLFICQRCRSRGIGYKPLYCCAIGIKLTDVKTMKTVTKTSLYIISSDSLVQQIFDDVFVWSVLKLTLNERNYKVRKSIDLHVRQIPVHPLEVAAKHWPTLDWKLLSSPRSINHWETDHAITELVIEFSRRWHTPDFW